MTGLNPQHPCAGKRGEPTPTSHPTFLLWYAMVLSLTHAEHTYTVYSCEFEEGGRRKAPFEDNKQIKKKKTIVGDLAQW